MSADDLRWLFGIALTTLGLVAGMLVGAFRALSGKIDKGNASLSTYIKDVDAALHGKVDKTTDALHERINRVKDEYVRRVDLDQRLQAFETVQNEMRGDVKAIRDSLLNRRNTD